MNWVFRDGWCRCAAPGLFLGVSTRSLGNMKAPRAFARALRRQGLDPARWAGGKQVHGRRVIWAKRASSAPEGSPAADGAATDAPGLALRVFAADCAPVFLVDRKRRAFALVHAGWRGTRKGVLEEALRLLTERARVRPGDLWMAVGPHIRSCCYEVGEDVAGAFARFPEAVKRTAPGKYRFSLARVLAAKAARAGVKRAAVSPHCTACDRRFFSHRRDKTDMRHAAVAALPRAPSIPTVAK